VGKRKTVLDEIAGAGVVDEIVNVEVLEDAVNNVLFRPEENAAYSCLYLLRAFSVAGPKKVVSCPLDPGPKLETL
jgi:hypothetical protein